SVSRSSGSWTRAVRSVPRVARTSARTVPSPPSASGISSIDAAGNARRTPRAIADATATASADPLNDCGATITRGAASAGTAEILLAEPVVAHPRLGESSLRPTRSVWRAIRRRSRPAGPGSLGRWIAAEHIARAAFSYVPEESGTTAALAAPLRAAGYRVDIARLVASPRLDLPADFESYVHALNKTERHELRRKIRRLET